MSKSSLARWLGFVCAVALWALPFTAFAHEPEGPTPPPDEKPAQLEDVGIDEHLGQTIPLEVTLNDETGKPVQLQQFFSGQKPVFLFFVYHSCPTLCSMVQSAVTASLKGVAWSIGDKYEVLTISIDPRDTPAIAAEKKTTAITQYGRDTQTTANGWHFLTGTREQVHKLSDAVGFRYTWNERQQQFAHSAGVFILTPTGKIARYLYGIDFPPQDVRLGLAEAAEGRESVGAMEHFLLYCYQYDPYARGYVLQAWKVMRVGAAACAVLLVGFLATMWIRERNKKGGGPSGTASSQSNDVLKRSTDGETVSPVTPS